MNKTILVKYVKKGSSRKKVGVVVATGKFNIGYSLCNKLDIFNKKKALEIATGRAEKGFENLIPRSVIKDFREMTNRAVSYFK